MSSEEFQGYLSFPSTSPVPEAKQAGSSPEGAKGESSTLTRAGNMYAQLESMMSAVRKEAMALESMKQKLKEMEGLRNKIPEFQAQIAKLEGEKSDAQRSLSESLEQFQGLKSDMQRLNDLYNNERKMHVETKQENVQLGSELSKLQKELSFLQRESAKLPELRKQVQAVQNQLSEKDVELNQLQESAKQNLHGMKKKLEEVEREKLSAYTLFTSLSEDTKKLKAELKTAAEDKLRMEDKLASAHSDFDKEREKLKRELEQAVFREEKQIVDSGKLMSDIGKLREAVSEREEAINSLQLKLRQLEEVRSSERADGKGKIAELSDSISSLKDQNYRLERQLSDSQHKLGLLGGDVSRYRTELESLQRDLTEKELARMQKEAAASQQVLTANALREEVQTELQKSNRQIDALNEQLRAAQNSGWEETQKLKQAHAMAEEEIDVLQKELNDKSIRLKALEAEKLKTDEYARGEVMNASQLTHALRGELEKRLEELTRTRKERDGLVNERQAMAKKIDELEESSRSMEAVFKKALETDRTKIQQEVRAKMTRLRALESEKEELLRETNELSNEVNSLKKSQGQSSQEVVELRRALEDTEAKHELAKASNLDLQEKLENLTRSEMTTKDLLAQQEGRLKAEKQRLDSAVKDAKKEAAQQILEMSAQLKSVLAEVEAVKARNQVLENSERKVSTELEKSKNDSESTVRGLQQQLGQLSEDINILRRENKDFKNKITLMEESRSRTDMETMAVQVELSRMESECANLKEVIRDQERRLRAADEHFEALRQENEANLNAYKKLKVRVVELDESVLKKNKHIEKQTKEINQLEKDGVAEVKRLRLQVAASEREVLELKPLVASLQKELSDGKTNFAKLQQSSNSSVNGLLEELKATEDALSAERKKNQSEIEKYLIRISELQGQLERSKETLEEQLNRTKLDKNDKDLRFLQMEHEVERLKDALAGRDRRLEELEKTRQSDRSRLHDLREQLEEAERKRADAVAQCEMEQAQRKLLATRLKNTDNDLAKALEAVERPNAEAPSFAARVSTKKQSEDIESFESDFPSFLELRGAASEAALDALSPRRRDNSLDLETGNFQSPVDRVSAALAKRAAAESQNAFRKAQQLRVQNRQLVSSRSAGESEYKDASLLDSNSAPTSSGKDQLADDAEGFSANVGIVDNVKSKKLLRRTDDVEDTIRKTQMFLQERMNGARNSNSNSNGDSVPSRQQRPHNSKASKAGDKFDDNTIQDYEKLAKSASMLASEAFRRHNLEDAAPSQEGDEFSTRVDLDLEVPSLQEVEPPRLRQHEAEEEDAEEQLDAMFPFKSDAPKKKRAARRKEKQNLSDSEGAFLPRINVASTKQSGKNSR